MKTLLTIIFVTSLSYAQLSEKEIRQKLDLIYNGQAERVRTELPTLQKQNPNDAGLLYVEAILTSDGAKAVILFQKIVENYSESIWADDALYKQYQYYYSIGLYKTADQKMEQLKKQYPTSIFVSGEDVQPIPTPKKETVETPTTPKKNVEVKKGKYAIQIGAYSLEETAKKQINTLENIGQQAIITTKQSNGKTLYVVSIEGFMTEQETRNVIADLKSKHNIESIIVSR